MAALVNVKVLRLGNQQRGSAAEPRFLIVAFCAEQDIEFATSPLTPEEDPYRTCAAVIEACRGKRQHIAADDAVREPLRGSMLKYRAATWRTQPATMHHQHCSPSFAHGFQNELSQGLLGVNLNHSMQVDMRSIFNNALSMLLEKQVTVTLDGRVRLKRGWVSFSKPFHYEGRQDLNELLSSSSGF